MNVPNAAIPKIKITPDITSNIEKIIKENTGLNMHITIVEHEDEKKGGAEK